MLQDYILNGVGFGVRYAMLVLYEVYRGIPTQASALRARLSNRFIGCWALSLVCKEGSGDFRVGLRAEGFSGWLEVAGRVMFGT